MNDNQECEVLLNIQEADWVLSGQCTHCKLKSIYDILSRPTNINVRKESLQELLPATRKSLLNNSERNLVAPERNETTSC
ncbi:hypothetical protein GWI33_001654 [Rhynchophorus ferrugineus]|uniref:Uncharacterized protein n=1 Tax=Rhynchophorus ferrugineus TaxID=354439 RepID=A0A834MGT5_RHYFE|nr:hypothetical protein GWI33_001654 [Rhynchophorus ferrugineus]